MTKPFDQRALKLGVAVLGVLVAATSVMPWATYTTDTGARLTSGGWRLGGPFLLALGAIATAAALWSLWNDEFWPFLLSAQSGGVATTFALVRALEIEGRDFPFSFTTSVELPLWIAVGASFALLLSSWALIVRGRRHGS